MAHWLDTYYSRGGVGAIQSPMYDALWAALQGAGFDGNPLQYAFVLCYMESGGFANTLAKKDNNPGSITFVNQPGATKGSYMAANKTYAAHFNSLADFARDLHRILSLPPGHPIQAVNLKDFVHGLKLNKYMGKESEASYMKKMQATAQRLAIVQDLQTDADQKVVMPSSGGGLFAWMKSHPIWTGVGAAGLGVLVVKNVSK